MHKEEIENYYSTVYGDESSRFTRLRELIPQSLERTSKVLDYGCGTGIFAYWLSREYGFEIDAFDIDEGEINKAREVWCETYGAGINFVTIDTLGNTEARYDAVFSLEVMEHVHNHGEYMNKVNRMLKKDAYYIVSVPNVSNVRFLMQTLAITNDKLIGFSKNMSDIYSKGAHHIHSWDPYHFITLMASCGFELEKWIPMEGMAMPTRFPKAYINRMNKTKFGNLCHIMAFRFRKVRECEWSIDS